MNVPVHAEINTEHERCLWAREFCSSVEGWGLVSRL